jgi:hypothetical protein
LIISGAKAPVSHPVPLGDFREDPSGVFSVSPKREILPNLAEAQRLRLRPCGAAVGSWSAGKSGRFEVQESADTDWGVEPVVNLKAAILERVGTSNNIEAGSSSDRVPGYGALVRYQPEPFQP